MTKEPNDDPVAALQLNRDLIALAGRNGGDAYRIAAVLTEAAISALEPLLGRYEAAEMIGKAMALPPPAPRHIV